MTKVKQRIFRHLYTSWWVYVFVGVCFIAGIIFGSLGVNVLDEQQTSSLTEFLEEGFSRFDNDLNLMLTTKQAVIKNLYNLGKIFVLGLTVIGFPLILAIVFTRGFALGFTMTFLIQEKTLRGWLLALFAVIPPNLVSLPAYFLGAVTAINFSIYLVRGRNNPKGPPISQYFLSYLVVMMGLSVLMLGAALIEGYLSPLVIKLLK